MATNKKQPTMLYIAAIFCVCFVFRFIEYMLIQTDRSVIGEAFLHKLVGIAVLAAALKVLHWQWRGIGFGKKNALSGIGAGLLIGLSSFAVAYCIEYFILSSQGATPSFNFYISAYSLSGNIGQRTGIGFFILCIVGNIINVVMEEGIFRGLYIKLLEKKRGFMAASLLSSCLFGLWHIMAPLRSYLEGTMQFTSLLMACLMQVLITGLMGFMLCLWVKISGNLWVAMAIHFVNNTIVNILHVTTQNAADELQVARITIAQTLTFLFALVFYFVQKAGKKQTFRQG